MPFISSVRGSYGAQGRFGKRISTLGLTSSNPAVSAAAIKTDNPDAPDGAYWLQPAGAPAPYLVHCYMTIEGGGWQLVLRNDSNFTGTGFGSGGFLVSNWDGWNYSNKSQVDSLGFDYSTAADTNCFTPNYMYAPFKDVMVIANRSGQQSKRLGWRHNSTISNMRSVIAGTSSRTVGNVELFGNPRHWLHCLDVRSDVNIGESQSNNLYGFKIRSDSGSGINSGDYVGGFTDTTAHYGAMIGCGRDSAGQPVGQVIWGGGFGGRYTTGGYYHRLHGHWWGHGDNRYSGAPDSSSAFYGHAVYIRA